MTKQDKVYKTEEEVLKRAEEAIGIPFEKINISDKLKETKGGVGKMIEEDWFGIYNNNRAEPDFIEAGVELKVTPYFVNSKGMRAKERLVCNIINYETENIDDFYESSYWKKNKRILLMSYRDTIPEVNAIRKKEGKKSLNSKQKYKLKKNFTIEKAEFLDIPEEDMKIIKHDWEVIADMIRNNKAHELSESQTMYLAACTKGSKSKKSMRDQRDSSAPKARQRAYSLKPSYMTYILNTQIYKNKKYKKRENVIKDISILDKFSLEDYIRDMVNPYIGKSQSELKENLDIKSSSKALNSVLISKILQVEKVEKSPEFKKAGIKVKTIVVEENGKRIKEDMSFPAFKFKELVTEEWEESKIKRQLIESKFMFVIFKKDKQYNRKEKEFDKIIDGISGKYEKGAKQDEKKKELEKHVFLNNIMFWQISKDRDIAEVKKVWKRTCEIALEGVQIREIKQNGNIIRKNNLPKKKDSRVAHVRNHSSKTSYEAGSPYSDELPDGRYITKQSFWFNNKYIYKQIKDYIL